MKKSAVVKESKKVDSSSKINKVQAQKKKVEDKSNLAVKKNNKNEIKNIEPIKQVKPKVTEIKTVPSPEVIKPVSKQDLAKKEIKAVKEKPKPEPTIADRMLNSVMVLFFIGFVLWILSSLALRTTEVQIAVKAQTVEREIQEIERNIDGLKIEIFELKSKDRLTAIAEELGLQYSWDRIKVIQD